MSCILTCEELYGMSIEEVFKSLIVLDENGCFALRSTAEGGGGGSYTFPANHGRVAYVSTSGNDSTGAVSNISKPFLTTGAAITALTAFGGPNPGSLVILSATSTVTISNYDYGSMVEDLSIHVMCRTELIFAGTNCIFSILNINSGNTVSVNTTTSFAIVANANIQCNSFTIKSTAQGSFDYFGTINCNYLIAPNNVNIACVFDICNWKYGMTLGTLGGVNYNNINPKRWRGKLSQNDTDAPTADIIIENDLGETLVLTRAGIGEYKLESPGSQFLILYTYITLSPPNLNAISQGAVINIGDIDPTASHFHVWTLDSFLGPSDTVLKNTDLLIEIYPEKY